MDLDPGIICYKNCSKGVTFGYGPPPLCRFCQKDFRELDTPPFRLPYPFVRANQSPCCVVIRPTKGDFLQDYRNSKDLHVGVTDSEGVVLEFDQNGLSTGKDMFWRQCVAIPMILDENGQTDAIFKEYWDCTLAEMTEQDDIWTRERYDENKLNCFTFALEFLRSLNPPILGTMSITKMEFCTRFVVPYFFPAARYVSLYRRLLYQDFIPVAKMPKVIDNEPLSTTRC